MENHQSDHNEEDLDIHEFPLEFDCASSRSASTETDDMDVSTIVCPDLQSSDISYVLHIKTEEDISSFSEL